MSAINARIPSLPPLQQAATATAAAADVVQTLAAPGASVRSRIPVLQLDDATWRLLRAGDNLPQGQQEKLRQRINGNSPTFAYMAEADLAKEGFPQVVVLTLPKGERRDEVYLAMGLFSSAVEMATNPELQGADFESKLQRILNTIPPELEDSSRKILTQLVTRLKGGETLDLEQLQSLQEAFIESFPDSQVQNVAIELPEAHSNKIGIDVLKRAVSMLTGGVATPFLGPLDYLGQVGNYESQAIPAEVIAHLPQYDVLAPNVDMVSALHQVISEGSNLSDDEFAAKLTTLVGEFTAFNAAQGELFGVAVSEIQANRAAWAETTPEKLEDYMVQLQLPNTAASALRLATYRPNVSEIVTYAPVTPEQTIKVAMDLILPHTEGGFLASFLPSSVSLPLGLTLTTNLGLHLANQLSPEGALPYIPISGELSLPQDPLGARVSLAEAPGEVLIDLTPEQIETYMKLVHEIADYLQRGAEANGLPIDDPALVRFLIADLGEFITNDPSVLPEIKEAWPKFEISFLNAFAATPEGFNGSINGLHNFTADFMTKLSRELSTEQHNQPNLGLGAGLQTGSGYAGVDVSDVLNDGETNLEVGLIK